VTTENATKPSVSEVEIDAVDPQRFASVLGEEQMTALRAAIESARKLLDGRTIWNVNSTAKGGGVAERAWEALADDVRARIHIACLPMDDSQENAAMVNALQRRANVVVQKSLAEGFGLTVAEAMWKSRPVVASRIGGIQDQIEDGTSGILLDDPHDREAFAAAVCSLLLDGERAERMGREAHARVQREFLGSRHLAQYVEICTELV
jgi:trehalose synthase